MSRLASTIFLAILFLASLCAFFYQSGSGKLSQVLGKPALKEGSPLVDFNRKEIRGIRIEHNGRTDLYKEYDERAGKKDFGWMLSEKEKAIRADHQKLEKLLILLDSASVINEISFSPSPKDSFHLDLIPLVNGVEKDQISLTLHQNLPRYTGVEPLIPTFAVTVEGRTYACTSELEEAFPRPTYENLLDKRPFYFHPNYLREFTYKHQGAEVVVTKPEATADWEISAPISLRADQRSVKSLISKIYSLEASEIYPSAEAPKAFPHILTVKSAITTIADQSVLFSRDLTQAYSPETKLLYTFPEETLAEVIPDIDLLRTKTLLKLDLTQVSSLLLQSKAQAYPVSLKIKRTESGSPRWMYQTTHNWLYADELLVADLINALTKDLAEGFSLETLPQGKEADKSVTVILKNGEKVHLNFFRNKESYHCQQEGQTQSALIKPSHFHRVKTLPSDWRVKKLWDFSPINLRGFQRILKGRPIENYSYNFNLEEWKGQIGSQRIDGEFDLVTANSFLDFLEGIHVQKWLPNSDPLIQRPATLPILTLTTLSEEFTDLGESKGVSSSTLTVLPVKSPNGAFLIRLEEEKRPTQFALLSEESTRRLATPLFYQD